MADFYQIWHRTQGVKGPHPHAKFHCRGCKNVGLEPHKSLKLVIFGIHVNLPKKGYTLFLGLKGIPFKRFFTKFGVREGVPGPHYHAKFCHYVCKKVGIQPPKSPKMVLFGINLPLKDMPGGRQKNLNTGAQLQTFLYAMAP